MPRTSKSAKSQPDAQGQPRPRKTDPESLSRLFDEWMQGDANEQRETFETLKRALDEARPVGYKLFS
jgi:hypothetical protein